MTTRKRALPMTHTRAEFQPETLDVEKRTVELVWTTGARVNRYDWYTGERWIEELSLDPAHVRLERINAGGPLLDNHRGYGGVSSSLGVVENAWIDTAKKEGRAVVRFAKDEDADKAFKRVQDKIIRNVSVGYSRRKMQKVEEVEGVPVMRVIDWEPAEISMVLMPADIGAGVRNNDSMSDCEFEIPTQEVRKVDENAKTPTQNPSPAGTESGSTPNAEAIRAEAVRAERERVSGIQAVTRKAGLGEEFARRFIESDASVEAVRAAALDELEKRSSASASHPANRVEITRDEVDTRRAAATNAILHRYNASAHQLTEAGRQFRGLSLLEIARDLMEARGEKVKGLSRMELAARAMHTTSDFPIILADVANKTLRQAYQAAPQTWRPFTRTTTLPDFKSVNRVQMGDAPLLTKVNEHGEYTSGSIGEGKETYKLETFGRKVAVTRQVLVNDDLDAFTRIPELFARAAANLESKLVWEQITGNPTMGDGVALFHASHGNIASAAAITVASLGAARALMRKQTSLDGADYLNLTPRFLLVPTALETVAEQFVRTVTADQAGNVNPFAGALQVIAEPRLDAADANGWYLACDPAQIDTIELAYLQGESGPVLESRMGFDVDGLEIKCRLDIGAKVIDHRGFVQNAGA